MIRFDERTDRPTIPHIVAGHYYGEIANWEYVKRSAKEWIDYQTEGVEADEEWVTIRLGDTVFEALDVSIRPARAEWQLSKDFTLPALKSRMTVTYPMANPFKWQDAPAELCEGRTVMIEVDDTSERMALRVIGQLLAKCKTKAIFYSDCRNGKAWKLDPETLEITNILGLENDDERNLTAARIRDRMGEARLLADD